MHINVIIVTIGKSSMTNITEAIKYILSTDSTNQEALKQGTLNLRAYATKIHERVETLTKKPVKLGSMVMVLSRLKKVVLGFENPGIDLIIEGLSIKTDLVVVNYEKTLKIIKNISQTHFARNDKDFFVITESLSEIAIIYPFSKMVLFNDQIKIKEKSKFTNAVAITLTFSDEYVTVPNVLHAFVSCLAAKKINLLQIVSTLTEVSFIIENKDMDESVNAFKIFLK